MGGVNIGYPILYEANETNFNNLGLGVLKDTISCIATEERNGVFELDMIYPSDGILFEEIENDRVIKCDTAHNLQDQLFRIVKVSRPINGQISVYAQHVSYALNGMQLRPEVNANSVNASAALRTWSESIVTSHAFSTGSDISTQGNISWSVTEVDSARRALGGVAGSILDVYGGEYKFDNYSIYLHAQRGNDNGVVIGYGKNITDVDQEENIETTYTSVYPFSKVYDEDAGEQVLITLDSPYYIDGPYLDKYAERKILLLDLSEKEIDTKEKLRAAAETYITANEVGVPKVSLKLSYIDLSKTLEYQDYKFFEQVNLCDIVTIHFEKLGIDTKAKVIRTEWNVLLERYDSIEIGEPKYTLTSKLNELNTEIKEKPSTSALMDAIANATAAITGNTGGYVVLRPSRNPEEILICDNPDYRVAQNVWRWNQAGLGFSFNGYQGPFDVAITANGEINANFITAGKLNAEIIEGGVLYSENLRSPSGGSTYASVGKREDGDGGGFTVRDDNISGDMKKFIEIWYSANGAAVTSYPRHFKAENDTFVMVNDSYMGLQYRRGGSLMLKENAVDLTCPASGEINLFNATGWGMKINSSNNTAIWAPYLDLRNVGNIRCWNNNAWSGTVRTGTTTLVFELGILVNAYAS